MTGRLQGKVAMVTGAGRGIGAAIATAFANEGADVIVAEIDPTTGERVAASVGGLFVPVDVAVPQSVEGGVAAAMEWRGRIDVLVNNAGINVFHEPLETSDVEWRRCLATDLEGAWFVSRAVLRHMLSTGRGTIVNIASSHASTIIPGTFPYPVAKHGLLGMTRALGIEYAARGIRVNAIAPGYILTPTAEAHWARFPDPDLERRRVELLHPPHRIGRPDEVAMTAVFLASDEAPFINAACIPIDGGRSVLYHD